MCSSYPHSSYRIIFRKDDELALSVGEALVRDMI